MRYLRLELSHLGIWPCTASLFLNDIKSCNVLVSRHSQTCRLHAEHSEIWVGYLQSACRVGIPLCHLDCKGYPHILAGCWDLAAKSSGALSPGYLATYGCLHCLPLDHRSVIQQPWQQKAECFDDASLDGLSKFARPFALSQDKAAQLLVQELQVRVSLAIRAIEAKSWYASDPDMTGSVMSLESASNVIMSKATVHYAAQIRWICGSLEQCSSQSSDK